MNTNPETKSKYAAQYLKRIVVRDIEESMDLFERSVAPGQPYIKISIEVKAGAFEERNEYVWQDYDVFCQS